jgi:hypothetical protein
MKPTLTLLALWLLAGCSSLPAAENKLNVLCLAVDEMNSDLGCFYQPPD